MQKVMIFGSGYLGLHLADALLNSGVTVGALTKNPILGARLKKRGISEVIVNQLESKSWHSEISGDYTNIVNCVSSSGGGISGYKKSYVQGQSSIIEWAKNQSIEQIIYTSSTSVYEQNNGSWVDESSIKSTDSISEIASLLRHAEELISDNSSFFKSHYILRLSGIYGPKRHYLLDRIKSEGEIYGAGHYYMNMIYVEDIVKVILNIIFNKNKVESGIFNLTDDLPVEKSVVVDWLSKRLNLRVPEFNQSIRFKGLSQRKRIPKDRKISNAKLKKEFGISFDYPTYREGYGNLIDLGES